MFENSMTRDPVGLGGKDFDQNSRQDLYRSFGSDLPPETFLKNVDYYEDERVGVSIAEDDLKKSGAQRNSFELKP